MMLSFSEFKSDESDESESDVQHRKALIHDGRAHKDAYPAGVRLNNHHVVKSCKNMTGMIIQ